MPNTGLIIFIKDPDLGHAKTRIANTVGQSNAQDIYRQLLDITRSTCNQYMGSRHLYYAEAINHNDNWDQTLYHKYIQEGDTLGQKMHQAISNTLLSQEGAILIGSDCPYINADLFDHYQYQLQFYDLIIGPSTDGGYYLIGMKEEHPSLFEDIPWSTEHVTQMTIDKAKELGLTYFVGPILTDIDYYEDWLAYQDKISKL